jgi:hypothetical protein
MFACVFASFLLSSWYFAAIRAGLTEISSVTILNFVTRTELLSSLNPKGQNQNVFLVLVVMSIGSTKEG